jgi:hypothetical protein
LGAFLLYTGLSDVIGPERAEVLMISVHLHDLDEVCTKTDLATTTAMPKADMAALRGGLKARWLH